MNPCRRCGGYVMADGADSRCLLCGDRPLNQPVNPPITVNPHRCYTPGRCEMCGKSAMRGRTLCLGCWKKERGA